MLAHLESELHSNRIPLTAHRNVGNESNSVCDSTPDWTLELSSIDRNSGGIKAVSKFPSPSPSLIPSSRFLFCKAVCEFDRELIEVSGLGLVSMDGKYGERF
jgi:hypothetical protein